MSPGQALPSFNLALHPDHYKTVLPNLSYPSRPITDIPWSESSASLLFSKTTRPEMIAPNIQVPIPTTGRYVDLAKVVNNRSKTQTNQAKALQRIKPRISLSPPVFEV